MDLDVRRLRVLREVALRGTVAAAADALGYTASAISQQLSALERECGSVLLERAGRRLRLTDAGELLVQRTEPVLAALEEAKAALEESRTTLAGDLRVATFGTAATWLVMPVVAELAASHPELRVLVDEHDVDDGVRELRLGVLDVVIAHEYDHTPSALEPDVVRVDLFAEDMFIAAPAGRFDSPIALAELAGERWAAGPETGACGRALRAACRQAGFEPDIRYSSNEVGVLLSYVGRTGAVSMLPDLAVQQVPAGVDVVRVADVPTRRLVFAVHRQGSGARPKVALVLDRLSAAARLLETPPVLAAAG